jgi:hypothetical protein
LQRELDADERDRRAEHDELNGGRQKKEGDHEAEDSAHYDQDMARLEEEERQKKKEMERELELRERQEQTYQPTTASGVVVGRIMTVEERKEAIQKLVLSLPADKEGICAWPIKWEFLDKVIFQIFLMNLPFPLFKLTDFLFFF